jgi:hypothetical protein
VTGLAAQPGRAIQRLTHRTDDGPPESLLAGLLVILTASAAAFLDCAKDMMDALVVLLLGELCEAEQKEVGALLYVQSRVLLLCLQR